MIAAALVLSYPMDYISEGTLFSMLQDQQTCLYALKTKPVLSYPKCAQIILLLHQLGL